MLVQDQFVAHQLLVCCCSVSRYEHTAKLTQPAEEAFMRDARQYVDVGADFVWQIFSCLMQKLAQHAP